jgi:allantoin racemase
MKILIINPNSDAEMTAAIQESAELFAEGAFEVRTLSTPGAPQFIESHGDEIQCGPGMMEVMKENEGGYDAFVIACHSDVHIEAARETTRKPVIGIGEASMKLASFLGRTFSVVTTHQHSVPGKLEQVRKCHLEGQLASVRAPDAGEEGLGGVDLFLELSRRAKEEDGAEVIVLGCAGLAGMDRKIREELDLPVLDGVVCALMLATGFARYGVGTSKVMYYNPDY